MSGWADGPEFATQCAIRPGNSYTYRFNLTAQEGTLWWHAHVSWLRATVHGALIIRPKRGRAYPFPKPYREVPILLGTYHMYTYIYLLSCLSLQRYIQTLNIMSFNFEFYFCTILIT